MSRAVIKSEPCAGRLSPFSARSRGATTPGSGRSVFNPQRSCRTPSAIHTDGCPEERRRQPFQGLLRLQFDTLGLARFPGSTRGLCLSVVPVPTRLHVGQSLFAVNPQ